MYGRSPLSVVVVCKPFTDQLKFSSSPKQLIRYSVITPFGFTGRLQLNEIEVEILLVRVNLETELSGPEKYYKMTTKANKEPTVFSCHSKI